MSLVADVFDLLIYDEEENDVIATTTLQDANIEINTESNDVRAGKGNQLISIIHSERDINIPVTDVEWKPEYLAMQLGQTVTTGAGEAYHMPVHKVAEEGAETEEVKITLDEEPKMENGEPVLLKIYDMEGESVTIDSVDGKDVLLDGVDVGDRVEVRTFLYETDEETEKIVIDDTVWPKDYKLILETLEIDRNEQPTHKLQYIFDRGKPTGEVTIDTESERDASTQEMEFRVLKPEWTTEVGRILRIKISE